VADLGDPADPVITKLDSSQKYNSGSLFSNPLNSLTALNNSKNVLGGNTFESHIERWKERTEKSKEMRIKYVIYCTI